MLRTVASAYIVQIINWNLNWKLERVAVAFLVEDMPVMSKNNSFAWRESTGINCGKGLCIIEHVEPVSSSRIGHSTLLHTVEVKCDVDHTAENSLRKKLLFLVSTL